MLSEINITQPPSRFSKLILFEFALRNKSNLHFITSFASQGKLLNEIYSVPWEDDGILPRFSYDAAHLVILASILHHKITSRHKRRRQRTAIIDIDVNCFIATPCFVEWRIWMFLDTGNDSLFIPLSNVI